MGTYFFLYHLFKWLCHAQAKIKERGLGGPIFPAAISFDIQNERKTHVRTMTRALILANTMIHPNIHARSPAGGKILWYFHRSYGLMAWDADLTAFEKKMIFLNFRYICFILGRCGRKQLDFMGGMMSSFTRLKINTFSSVILLNETFSKWNSRLYAKTNLSRHLVTDCQLMHHWSRTSKIAVSFYGEHCFQL